MILRSNKVSLTPRQVECLSRISMGDTTHEIARALGLSRHTVDHYVSSACDKLHAKTRAHAVALAILHSLIDDADDPDSGEK